MNEKINLNDVHKIETLNSMEGKIAMSDMIDQNSMKNIETITPNPNKKR